MSLSETLSRRVTRLLHMSTGASVHIVDSEPMTSSWSAQFETYPWIRRCTLEAETSAVPASVIVKVRRTPGHNRSEPERFSHEHAALEFLTSLGSAVGPRLLAADEEAGILIMEDLGTGPTLENLLVGDDSSEASQGLVAFAATLGRMHATTSGHVAQYYQIRRRLGSVDPAFDRVSISGIEIEHAWRQLQEIVAMRPSLPTPHAVDADIHELLHVLSEPCAYLAFSNGDACPANCLLSGDALRLLDFEQASFRHALLDVTALRFPFPACGCWSRLPEDVGRRAENAYRKEMARSCPDILDHASYAHGLTVACAAWTIVRMVRLPKLEQIDEPHPMGFSRRGQLLDMIRTTVSCSQHSHTLRSFASWLASVHDVLQRQWSHITAPQPLYPAFQLRNSPT